MPFLSFLPGGLGSVVTATNPYITTANCRGHVILAHPTEANGLILTRGSDTPYKRGESGYLKGEGRSIAGSLKMTGAPVKKYESTCNFIVDLAMADHFRRLLSLQQSTVPITVIDNWTAGRSQTFTADISIGDAQWETPQPNRLFLLQFILFES